MGLNNGFEMTKACHLCGISKYTLFETPDWSVLLNFDQNYPGRILVNAKRHMENLPSLTSEEWKDLHTVILRSEKMIKKAFPEVNVLNWSCLMNHAFKEKPYNSHVHWHVFPRHDKPVSLGEITWTDERFGNHYGYKKENILTDEKLEMIFTYVLKHA